jgi:NADH:ubiquinone reductase (non-electrogenic)
VGARAADYGVPGVREHASKLADLDDARAIRRRILECFALAALPGRSDAEIADRLRFVVCGGGPTGVEIAAEIHDELEAELARSFPGLAEKARVVLIEAGARLLGGFDEALSGYTAKHFRREGIELRFDSPVARVERDAVWFRDGSALRCGLLVWAAGTEPAPLTRALDAPLDARGRIVTDATFRVAGRPGLWALGDCAAVGDPPLPATAQVAQQQGAHLAKLLVAHRAGRPLRPFRFRSFGMLAYIGGHQALADLPAVKWSGRGAFLFWRSVYLTKLVSLANKTKVLFDWIKTTLFGRDLSRF